MKSEDLKIYEHLRLSDGGFYEQNHGLIAVWGSEAVQFLDGMITNDVKTLADGKQMLAAFPNAQGRLLAVVRVLRQGDRFLIETEEATREKVFQNLFRFTFAGDFFAEDVTDKYVCFDLFGRVRPPDFAGTLMFSSTIDSCFVPTESADEFRNQLISRSAAQITDEVYDTLRIEHGVPKYGIDMDETTVVPELGLEGLISYNKGCYIGQEIIARIHFRGHVAKQLTGLVLAETVALGTELRTADDKPAGRITSVTYSPALDKTIALGFVRYDYLAEGTDLRAGSEIVTVTKLPFSK
jgi:aminomethyltransferase